MTSTCGVTGGGSLFCNCGSGLSSTRTYPDNTPPGNCDTCPPGGEDCGDGVCERLPGTSFAVGEQSERAPGGNFKFENLPDRNPPGGDHLASLGMPHEPNDGGAPKPNGDLRFETRLWRTIRVDLETSGTALIHLLDVTVIYPDGKREVLNLGYQFNAVGGPTGHDVVSVRKRQDIDNPLDPIHSPAVDYAGLYTINVRRDGFWVPYKVRTKDNLREF